MSASTAALRIVPNETKAHNNTSPAAPHTNLKIHTPAPVKATHRKKNKAANATMAKCRKALRWEAMVLHTMAQIIAVLSIVAEGIVFGLYYVSGISMDFLGEFLILLAGLAMGLVGIVVSKLLFGISRSLIQEARKLRMEE